MKTKSLVQYNIYILYLIYNMKDFPKQLHVYLMPSLYLREPTIVEGTVAGGGDTPSVCGFSCLCRRVVLRGQLVGGASLAAVRTKVASVMFNWVVAT